MEEIVTLDHGSGGKKTAALLQALILPALGNPLLNALGDAAVAPLSGPVCFTTDSFVVSPYFFPGGDVGKLCVCGTVNDVLMAGGQPQYLSLALILEEGLPMRDLALILGSLARCARESGVTIVTGDTKVVERGKGDGIYINTAGIGMLRHADLTPRRIVSGDAVILSGTAGDHGAAVMLARQGMGGVESDCAPLCDLAEALLPFGDAVRALRDPTRGGVATTLNEFAADAGLSIELTEADIPVRPDVRAGCALLGLDPLYCANEGKLLAVVDAAAANDALAALRACPHGESAAIIGRASMRAPGRVLLNTALGGTRILQKLSGAQLPRIC